MRGRVGAAVLVLALGLVGCGGEDEPVAAGAQPKAGTWKTWVLASPEDVKVAEPPTGAKARAEADELRALATQRTPEVEEKIKRWNQNPALKPWMDINIELVAHGVKDPPLASRGYSYTTIAIYDAVVAAWRWKYEYDRKAPTGADAPDPSYPSEHAAIAGAASRVLEYIFPEEPVGIFDQFALEAAEARVQAGLNYRSDVEAGLALGRAVAEKVIARAKADGADRTWDGTRPPGIGRGPEFWEPPPGTITPPTQPLAGTWKTWILDSPSQFRAPPPPKYGSPEFLAEAREVMDVRAKLTPEQERIARFWAGGQGSALPPGQWNQVAFVYVDSAKLDTPRAARLFAGLNVALNDAALAVWDTKFTYWSPRPVNAIRDLGLDPNWRSLLPTPTFPSYVSGHSGYSAAAAAVLSYFFPSDAATFDAKAQEAAVSRLYGGIHFRSDNDQGAAIGKKIGDLTVQRLKQDGAERSA
ncbi:MAG: phosphatase PAP2 family protein [Actinomycetota bacterium]|nr:phosphatase PAP2 family protein [Actinomycetota bacterium]